MSATNSTPAKTKRIPRLHVITDETVQTRYTHVELTELAGRGGADAVQYREKRDIPTKLLVATARAMLDACTSSCTLVVDDRADVAVAAGAGAIHLGAQDLDVATARLITGPDTLIGGTANSLAEARSVWHTAVDYLGVGPIYGTRSKANPAPDMGLEQLSQICTQSPKPVIAIGSISAARINEVMSAGAHGVAVLSTVVAAPDPAEATADCLTALQAAVKAATN